MKPKRALGRAILAVVVLYGIKFALKAGGEWVRYDKIRAMSNEPPVATEIPKLAGQAAMEERATLVEIAQFFAKMPIELGRYLKMESM